MYDPHYINTFGLLEGEDAGERLQSSVNYGSTVHVFIGTGRNPSKSRFMSLSSVYNYNMKH